MREYINGWGNITVSLYHESSGTTRQVCCSQRTTAFSWGYGCRVLWLFSGSPLTSAASMYHAGGGRLHQILFRLSIGHGGVDRNEQRIFASTPCQHHWCLSKVCCWYGMASTTLEKWWLERTIDVCINDCRINRMPYIHFLFVLHNDTALCCMSNLMSNADISQMFSGLIARSHWPTCQNTPSDSILIGWIQTDVWLTYSPL